MIASNTKRGVWLLKMKSLFPWADSLSRSCKGICPVSSRSAAVALSYITGWIPNTMMNLMAGSATRNHGINPKGYKARAKSATNGEAEDLRRETSILSGLFLIRSAFVFIWSTNEGRAARGLSFAFCCFDRFIR